MPARPRTARPKAARPRAARPTASAPRGVGGRRRVPSRVLTQFTLQLSTLQNAGLPLVRSLRILEGQLPAGPFKGVVEAVADDVEGGTPLSEALAKYPAVFDRLYVNMVRAGEAGGVLGTVLERLAEFSRKSEDIRGQVRSALTYPVLVLAIALLIVTFVLTVVVPRFEEMFTEQGFGVAMPAPTRVLMAVSDALVSYWYLALVLPVLLVAGWRAARRNEAFARRVDAWKLAVPLVGPLQRKTIIARFSRTLGTLLQNGVPILEALTIVRESVPNRVLAGAVGAVAGSIREGETIARPLGESGVFDDVVVNMIDVGEETGRLDEMLLRVADIFEREVDVAVTTLFKALEPLLLLVMAVLVGFVVVALFLPIVEVMDSFSAG